MRLNLTCVENLGQDCVEAEHSLVRSLLTFNHLPFAHELKARVWGLTNVALFAQADEAVIDGPTYLVIALAASLKKANVKPFVLVRSVTWNDQGDKIFADNEVSFVAV